MRVHHTFVGALVATVVGASPVAAFDPDNERTGRVFVEVGTGVLGGALGGLAGAAGGLLICLLDDDWSRGWSCLVPVVVGSAVFAWGGMAAGVWAGGELMGANGGAGWELLGQASGTAAAGLVFALLDDDIDSEVFWWSTWIVLPLAGGILGYELSTENTSAGARSSALVVPFMFSF